MIEICSSAVWDKVEKATVNTDRFIIEENPVAKRIAFLDLEWFPLKINEGFNKITNSVKKIRQTEMAPNARNDHNAATKCIKPVNQA